MSKVNEVALRVSITNKVNDVNEVNVIKMKSDIDVEAKVEVSDASDADNSSCVVKGKPPEVPLRSDFVAKVQAEKSGMKEVKFDVNTKAMEGSGVKEVMQSDGLTKMKKNEQSRCANWDPSEPVDAKAQTKMSDAEEAKILVNINKVGLQLFMKEVWSSGGAIEKALLIVMFLLKERFVNSFSPLSVIELSEYG